GDGRIARFDTRLLLPPEPRPAPAQLALLHQPSLCDTEEGDATPPELCMGTPDQEMQASTARGADSPVGRELIATVYDQLRALAQRQLANEPPDLTIQATALVHEAYLRLDADPSVRWDSQRHYFAAAAIAM